MRSRTGCAAKRFETVPDVRAVVESGHLVLQVVGRQELPLPLVTLNQAKLLSLFAKLRFDFRR